MTLPGRSGQEEWDGYLADGVIGITPFLTAGITEKGQPGRLQLVELAEMQ